MSNVMYIVPTKFIDARTGEESFGVRIWDNEAQCYDNSWDSIPEDNMEVLKKVVAEPNSEVSEMLDHVKENNKGISIGGNYYDWDEIEKILCADEISS